MNYTDADLLRLTRAGYTWEELEFNRLKSKIIEAEERFRVNISKAATALAAFGIREEEVREFAERRVFGMMQSGKDEMELV